MRPRYPRKLAQSERVKTERLGTSIAREAWFARILPSLVSFRHPPVGKRQFISEGGVAWVVWDVHPDDLGRMAYDRRSTTPSMEASPRIDRVTRQSERTVHPELEKGWLCFQSGTEKRRFTPIPTNWHELPDSVLRVMLDTATPAPHADGRVTRPSVTD